MSLCKLTVCFEESFWVGIVETENNGAYSVARHVFGAEPTTPEVFNFICDHWNDLRFTHDVQVEVTETKRINPKRLQRMIKKRCESTRDPAQRRSRRSQSNEKWQRKLVKRYLVSAKRSSAASSSPKEPKSASRSIAVIS